MFMLDMINKRAEKTFELKEEDNILDHNIWFKHWFATADEIKEEFRKEGLVNTVQHIEKLVAKQKTFMRAK